MTKLTINTLRPEVEIYLSFPNQEGRRGPDTPLVFLASQKVAGAVQVRYRKDSFAFLHDHLDISLIGCYDAKTWLPNHPYGEPWDFQSKTEEILRLSTTFRIDPASGGDTHALKPSPARHFDFSFQLLEGSKTIDGFHPIDYSRDRSYGDTQSPVYTQLNSLPSSAKIKISGPRVSGTAHVHEVLDVRIAYNILATITRKQEGVDKIIARTCTEICILDDSFGVQPPTCTADFGGEYCMQQRATLRANKMSVPKRITQPPQDGLPAIWIRASEPRPLIFRGASRYATTNAPLTLALQTSRRAMDSEIDTIHGRIAINWRLQKCTYCAFTKLKEVPTLRLASSTFKPTAVQRKSTLSDRHAYEHDLAACEWQREAEHCWPNLSSVSETAIDSSVKASDNNITTRNPTTFTTIPIPVQISRDLLPAPTSFTPYMAVRYIVQIHVVLSMYSFDGGHAHCATISATQEAPKRKWYRRLSDAGSVDRWVTEANLKVPVQIVYDTSPSVSADSYPVTERYSLDAECDLDVGRDVQEYREQDSYMDVVVDTLPSYFSLE